MESEKKAFDMNLGYKAIVGNWAGKKCVRISNYMTGEVVLIAPLDKWDFEVLGNILLVKPKTLWSQ